MPDTGDGDKLAENCPAPAEITQLSLPWMGTGANQSSSTCCTQRWRASLFCLHIHHAEGAELKHKKSCHHISKAQIVEGGYHCWKNPSSPHWMSMLYAPQPNIPNIQNQYTKQKIQWVWGHACNRHTCPRSVLHAPSHPANAGAGTLKNI